MVYKIADKYILKVSSDIQRLEREQQVNDFLKDKLPCLPNILALGSEVSGIIDTESCGIGDPWIDYAWCIWSFEYNIGSKEYTPMLLQKLGIEFDEEKYRLYINEEELK